MGKKKKNNNSNNTTNIENNTKVENATSKEIFVFGQTIKHDNGTILHSVTLELLNAAQELSKHYDKKLKVSSVLCSTENIDNFDEIKKTLYQKGADKVYIIKNEKIKNHIGIAKAISELCENKKPEIFLIGATTLGRTIAPLISSKLDTGLTADCTKLEITNFKDEKKLVASRPTFGGQLMASILCKKTPQMATVRPSVLKKTDEIYKNDGEFEEFYPNFEDFNDPITILNREKNNNKFSSSLENAQIIVAGGKGLKTEENFEKLKRFANLMGAAYAGSRGAVDMGLIDKEYQIGQTGKTVAPRVYIAFGISGAIHHIVGINNAKKIIAVNNDEHAPIFENADVAIVEDATRVLDELIEELEDRMPEK